MGNKMKSKRLSINFFVYLLEHLIFAIIVGYITYLLTKSEPFLHGEQAVGNNKKYIPDLQGDLKLIYEDDEYKNLVELLIESNGKKPAEEVVIDIKGNKKDIFGNIDIVYEPSLIKDFLTEIKTLTPEHFQYHFKTLPIHSKVYFSINCNGFISKEDISTTLLGSGTIWEIKVKDITLKKSRRNILNRIFGSLVNENSLYAQENKNSPASIYIGGYDPVKLSNGIFSLIQKKNLITKQEAEEIKKIVEQSKSGLSIGGINILKFDEVLINTLINKRVLSMEEANNILEKSKKVGGLLINGYNVIQIKYEILNHLYKKGYISLNEAQSVIDKAKHSE